MSSRTGDDSIYSRRGERRVRSWEAAGPDLAIFPYIYIGIVKDVVDVRRTGRLRVWIPEICGYATENDPSVWITVDYCSPFAGATDIVRNVPGSESWKGTQIAYGFWAVPPDLDNEVLVAFINGHPGRGVWFGCLYQHLMNHSVPTITQSPSFAPKEESCGVDPPTVEYNKVQPKEQEGAGSANWLGDRPRPRHEALHEAFKQQGLYTDPLRGPTRASARRQLFSRVYGIVTPRGHSIYIDDGVVETDENGRPLYEDNEMRVVEDAQEYIRLRTRNGSQILIGSNPGTIYMITPKGNSWLELTDEGVTIYTKGSWDVRTQGDFNLRVDGNANIEIGGELRLRTMENTRWRAEGKIDIRSAAGCKDLEPGIRIETEGNLDIHSLLDVQILADGSILRQAGELISDEAPLVVHNGGIEAAPEPPEPPEPERRPDRDIDRPDECYPVIDIECDSILPEGHVVTHEPWERPFGFGIGDVETPAPESEVLIPEIFARGVEVECEEISVLQGESRFAVVGQEIIDTRTGLPVETTPVENLDPSPDLVDMIANTTPFLDDPVQLPDGRWLVGWGTRIGGGQDLELWRSSDFRKRRALARAFLEEELAAAAETARRKFAGMRLTQGMFDAIVSQIQSFGAANFDRIGLTRAIIEFDFDLYHAITGCVGGAVTGRRRDAEKSRFERIPDGGGTAPPKDIPGDATCSGVPDPSPEVLDAIKQASQETGADYAYMLGTAATESSFDPNARANGSSAAGLYQITRPTWNRLVRKYGKQDGVSEEDRLDPYANAKMAGRLANENAEEFERITGQPPSRTDLYMAHFLGPREAARFAMADQNTPATQLVSEKVAASNRHVFYDGTRPRTVGEIRRMFRNKVEGCGTQLAGKFPITA